jgi:DNA adenine methylase
VKPPVPYFGGKITLAPLIASYFPPHRHYVEPYCGSLAVLLAKDPAPFETVNDLDGELVNFWAQVRNHGNELARLCALTPHARAELQDAYNLTGDLTDLERARRVWVQLTQGRAGTRRRTGWRQYIAPRGNTSMPDYLIGYLERLGPAGERLHAVSLECMPALELIAKFGAHEDVLLYVDPPYPGSTRCRSWDGYIHEMRDDSDHRALAEALRAARAAVVLSGYPSELYDLELYPDWYRHTMTSGTGQGGEWANRTEVLWANRPFGSQLQLFSSQADVSVTTAAYQPALMSGAAGLVGVHLDVANALLTRWGHYLEAMERPFGWQCFVLDVAGEPVSVAVSASTVSSTVAGYNRHEVVELARLCSAPEANWATRPMLRLWREVGARCWLNKYPDWQLRAAVAYSQNSRHNGQIYRFDGWTRITDRAGAPSGPGATWSKPRGTDHPAVGRKSLWLWQYPMTKGSTAT